MSTKAEQPNTDSFHLAEGGNQAVCVVTAAERPAFGTAPIRCSRRRCKWKGYETEMKKVQHPTINIATQNICPTCGCDSYYFMTPKEISAWEKANRAAKGQA